MKKARNQIKVRILDEIKLKVETLINSPGYEKDINELHSIQEKLSKVNNRRDYNRLLKESSDKEDSMRSRYDSFFSIETLKSLSEDEIADTWFPFGELRKIVDIIQLRPIKFNKTDSGYTELADRGILDDKGYVHIKVNPLAPREIIHSQLDWILDRYGNKSNIRWREGKLEDLRDGLKIYDEHKKGKPLLQITKERCGIDESPAYNPTVKAHYEKVKRLYKMAKEIKEP